MADVWQVLLGRRLVTDSVGSDAHKVFERDMADLSDAQIALAADRAKDFVGFFTFPAFRELCRTSPEDYGLPAVHAAYLEAAMSDGPRDRCKWSHAAVYFAGRETGWFELRTFTEKEIFPRFKRNYEVLCARVINGEVLDLPVQQALPQSIPVYLTPEQNKSRCAALKEMLT